MHPLLTADLARSSQAVLQSLGIQETCTSQSDKISKVIEVALNNQTSLGKSSFLKSLQTCILSPWNHTLQCGKRDNNNADKAGPKDSHLVASEACTGTENDAISVPSVSENVMPIPAPYSPKDPSHLTTTSYLITYVGCRSSIIG